MTLKNRVLILEGANPVSLAVARSLGRKGVDITIGESFNFSTAQLSKYCKSFLKYSSPETQPDKFIQKLLEEENDYDVIYPISDDTSILLSKYKYKFKTKIAVADWDIFQITNDKNRLLKIAEEINIPYPKTCCLGENFNFVIKPYSKTTWVDGKLLRRKVTSNSYIHYPLKDYILQEYIGGQGYGCCALIDNEVKAVFTYKRLREYPITGGASTLRESIHNQELVDLSLSLLKKLDWKGIAMVEWKLDERDMKFKLIEINGRWWGSLPLGIASGVDFPYLYHQVLIGENPKPIIKYSSGIKCRCLFPNDLLWILKTGKFLELFKYYKDDVLSWSDFLPTIGILRSCFKYLFDIMLKKKNIYGEIC